MSTSAGSPRSSQGTSTASKLTAACVRDIGPCGSADAHGMAPDAAVACGYDFSGPRFPCRDHPLDRLGRDQRAVREADDRRVDFGGKRTEPRTQRCAGSVAPVGRGRRQPLPRRETRTRRASRPSSRSRPRSPGAARTAAEAAASPRRIALPPRPRARPPRSRLGRERLDVRQVDEAEREAHVLHALRLLLEFRRRSPTDRGHT